MDKTRIYGLRLLSISLLILIPACASGPPPGPSPAELAGSQAKTIIISPFNVVSALPPELEGSTKKTSRILVNHLEAHGKVVKVMAYRAGRSLWQDSMREVRDSGQKKNFANAAKVYARKIGEQLEFDALIIPSLFVQNAKTRGRRAKWDGVEQKVDLGGEMPTNSANRYGGNMGTMYVQAASLFVQVVNRAGVDVHNKRSGIELIQHLELVVEQDGGISGSERIDMVLVDDKNPIDDDERIRNAVAIALVPFLPEESPESADVKPAE